MNIVNLLRTNIINLKAYSSARDEYPDVSGIFLDANENPYGIYNRYPDPRCEALRQELSRLKNIDIENIIIGNGSDEVIDMVLRAFCNPLEDRIIICPPTYGMYEVAANVNDIGIMKIPLNAHFQLDVDAILHTPAKVMFICNPNNPTSNYLDSVEEIIQNFQGIVVVDEAYIDFSKNPSIVPLIKKYSNLIVLQTLSKAWGAAGIRLGFGISSSEIISYLIKIKPPYNVSQINQEAALKILKQPQEMKIQVDAILEQRLRLETQLVTVECVKKIWPSDTNFLLVEVQDALNLYRYLVGCKIIVRNRHSVVDNCLRITVGTEDENTELIHSIQKYTYAKNIIY
jgi:histidinol-phosphate aminotransferase